MLIRFWNKVYSIITPNVYLGNNIEVEIVNILDELLKKDDKLSFL